MDTRAVIAQRIDLQLRRQLGEGVDAPRTLHDERYARDVLLVCDAMVGTDLPLLARQFRAAGRSAQANPSGGHDEGPPQPWAADTSGFGDSSALPPAAMRQHPQRSTPRTATGPRARSSHETALSAVGRWLKH